MNICEPSVTFKNVCSISDELMLNSIESNLKLFLDWSFLTIGAWFDVTRTPNNLYMNPYQLLKPAHDPGLLDGQAWDALKKDWVWEKGVVFHSCNAPCNKSPLEVSGIYKDGAFIDINSGDFSINYELGRVVFNTPIAPTSVVEAEYSYRHIQVYRANNNEWFNTIQYADPENKQLISLLENGDWKIGNNNTIQLPAIVIESIPRARSRPHEIGSGGLIIEQDFAFHILANNKNDRNKLIDILRLQQDVVIWLYDINKLVKDNNYPIDYDGNLKPNALMYPEIIDQYKWKKCWLKNINVFEAESIDPNMHRGTVRVTAEIIYA